MKIADLTQYGFSANIIKIWREEIGDDLLPLQEKAICEDYIFNKDSDNLLVVAPTSSGKTFIGELAAVREASRGNQSIFLVPFRAIAEEIYADFSRKYKDYGFRIAISDRDHDEFDNDIMEGQYDIAVIVYEKLSGLLVARPELLSGCTLVIADEVQMLMDRDRGPDIELLLTKLLLSNEKVRIIALSAVLDKLNNFDKWLRARVLPAQERPVELWEGVYTKDGTIQYREFNGKGRRTEDLSSWTDNKRAILNLVQRSIGDDEQILAFCNSRASTIETATFLAENLKQTSRARKAIRQANNLIDTIAKEEIQNLLQYGIAYHNSDLTLDEKLLIEEWFRKKEIKVIACTSTLSMGINVPARNVVIIEPTKWNGQKFISIGVAEYKNMVGRAGRYSAGDPYGRSYLVASSQANADQYNDFYISGELEGFASSFGSQAIDSQVLGIVASGLAKTPEEVGRFVFSTYNGKYRWISAESKSAIEEKIVAALERCFEYGAIETDKSGNINPTKQGKICASRGYSLEHLGRAVAYLSEYKADVVPSVIYWALRTDVSCGVQAYHIARPRSEEYKSGIYQQALIDLGNGEKLGPILESLALNTESISYEECVILKRSLACVAWLSDISIHQIENNFSGVRAGALRGTAEVCSWLVSLLAELAKIQDSKSERHLGLRILSERLQHGSTEEALELCRIRGSGLLRDERNNLVSKDIRNVDDILALKPNEFPLILPKAIKLIGAAEADIKDNVERRRRAQSRRLATLNIDTSLLDKLYEKNGTELEKVVDDLLSPPFIDLTCRSVTRQREGNPDHILYDSAGSSFVIQTTASEKNRNISKKKATSVIGQSASYKPVGYIVIGRPDFEQLAIRDAADQVSAGNNYKLLPVSTLAEMLVLRHEKKLSTKAIEEILIEWTGYIPIERLEEYKHLSEGNSQ